MKTAEHRPHDHPTPYLSERLALLPVLVARIDQQRKGEHRCLTEVHLFERALGFGDKVVNLVDEHAVLQLKKPATAQRVRRHHASDIPSACAFTIAQELEKKRFDLIAALNRCSIFVSSQQSGNTTWWTTAFQMMRTEKVKVESSPFRTVPFLMPSTYSWKLCSCCVNFMMARFAVANSKLESSMPSPASAKAMRQQSTEYLAMVQNSRNVKAMFWRGARTAGAQTGAIDQGKEGAVRFRHLASVNLDVAICVKRTRPQLRLVAPPAGCNHKGQPSPPAHGTQQRVDVHSGMVVQRHDQVVANEVFSGYAKIHRVPEVELLLHGADVVCRNRQVRRNRVEVA